MVLHWWIRRMITNKSALVRGAFFRVASAAVVRPADGYAISRSHAGFGLQLLWFAVKKNK
jgi:hypothetical protein